MKNIQDRYENTNVKDILKETQFSMTAYHPENSAKTELHLTDPWGTKFRVVEDLGGHHVDLRGSQPGEESEGFSITDITVHVPRGSNFAGIERFYEMIIGTPSAIICNEVSCVISVGPTQTLSFREQPTAGGDLDEVYSPHDNTIDGDEGTINFGPHISMYVAEFPSTYRRAEAIGVTYVNHRFKRRAYTLDEAIDQCMFRIIDIIDPENPEEGAILKLEHEIRSVVKRDGSKYKSCPFNRIPPCCLRYT